MKLTDSEKTAMRYALWDSRYKTPPFVIFLWILTAALFGIALVFANLGEGEDIETTSFSFWLGTFLSSIIITIVTTIREKDNWIQGKMEDEDASSKNPTEEGNK
jgi:hypothetical protein